VTIIDDHCQSFFLPKRQHKNIITILSFAASKTISATAGGALISFNHELNIKDNYSNLQEDSQTDALLRKKNFIKKYSYLKA
jgi:hypothetical protein